MKDNFSKFHPLVNFLYFTAVLLFSMFVLHPAFIVISLIGSLTYSIYLGGKKSLMFSLKYLLPMIIMVLIINPAFNHEGMTILCYLPTGNPLTLESIVYGAVTSVMMSATILWFSSLNRVVTSDKLMYLFGRIIPSLSLILSMIFRFIPRFKEQFNKVRQAQRCVGRDISNGSVLSRLKNAVKIFSIMISFSFENSIETADSMKSRGYGLKGRTAFTLFVFEKRDKIALALCFFLSAVICFGLSKSMVDYRYFPSIKLNEFNMISACIYIAYFFLCNIPMIINLKEDRKWKSLKAKI